MDLLHKRIAKSTLQMRLFPKIAKKSKSMSKKVLEFAQKKRNETKTKNEVCI